MSDEPTAVPDPIDTQLGEAVVTARKDAQDVVTPSDNPITTVLPGAESEKQRSDNGEINGGDPRSDSEAETVVLAGKDDGSHQINPRAIKHEGKNEDESTAISETSYHAPEEANLDENTTSTLDRRKPAKDLSTTTTADASYSSNLSSTASSPIHVERSSSNSRSDSEPARTKSPRDSDTHSKDVISRKRKLRTDEAEEKAQLRRRKRATSSDTADHSDRKEARKVSNLRSESPPTRSRHRAPSTQITDLQGAQKRRKPPPLQVGHRGKVSDENHAGSDDGGMVNGRPHLRKLISTDNAAMSPVKNPHKKTRDQNGRTALARAASFDEHDEDKFDDFVKCLKARPGDINVEDNAGNTPLQIASLEGNTEFVKRLLEAGCDILCKNVDSDTPLIDAVENGHLDVIKLLLKAGVDPRQSNAAGEEPIDLINSEMPNPEEIKSALIEAKGLYTGRRASEDQHGQPFSGKDRISANSPRASPSLHSARSPPPHLVPTRRTARSESTRNDLLYVNPTAERLREGASKGDIEMVDHILQMRPMGDTEAVLLAAKGGHDAVLSLLIAMGNPAHDPEPLASSHYKAGFNTPMLAAIGRGNTKVISLLLEQPGFDPTRRLYKNFTYHELAKERNSSNWEEEYKLLKNGYDRHSGKRSNGGSDSKIRGGVQQRETKATRREHPSSASATSTKRRSFDLTSNEMLIKKKRASEAGHGHSRTEPEGTSKAHDSSRDHLRVPPKVESRESSVAVSDREMTPLAQPSEKGRSFSDAGISAIKDRDPSRPKKRLVSSKVLKEDEEKKRRASLTSSSSSQERTRHKTGLPRNRTDTERQEAKDSSNSKLNPAEPIKKRSYQSVSPSDGNNIGTRRGSDVPQKLKRQRVNSVGSAKDQEEPALVQVGPARVANMISSSHPASTLTQSQAQGAAPVAFMGNSNTSPVKEDALSSILQTTPTSPKAQLETKFSGSLGTDQSQDETMSQDHIMLEQSSAQKEIPEPVEDAAKIAEELAEKQKQEAQLVELAAKERAIREEAQRAKEEAEKARLEEQKRIQEAEHRARLEREAEEAREEAKRQAEEAEKRLIEKERLRKEELARRLAEQEERERLLKIRKQEDEERRRKANLPNALRIAEELDPKQSNYSEEIRKWLPLYFAKGSQLDPYCDEQARDEKWIINLQVAPILAISDLGLSRCGYTFHKFSILLLEHSNRNCNIGNY